MTTDLKRVCVYTDGACSGNPGPGGYGVVLHYGRHTKELSGGFRMTTNNRMELLAAIVGLAALKERCRVDLYSDSKYVVESIEQGWAVRWRSRGWKRERNKIAANSDLWSRLLDQVNGQDVSFHWVRGHSGDPNNERCDFLAVSASQGPTLQADEGYESQGEYA